MQLFVALSREGALSLEEGVENLYRVQLERVDGGAPLRARLQRFPANAYTSAGVFVRVHNQHTNTQRGRRAGAPARPSKPTRS